MGNQQKIDVIDAKILGALLKDARTSFTDIAKDCNVQPNVIRTHYNQLKKNGIITGEIMEVQPEAFGYNCRATLRLRVDTNKIRSVVDQLEKMPEILRITGGVGRKNLLCFTIAKDVVGLNKVVKHIKTLSGVTSAEADLWVITTQGAFPENLQIIAEEY